MKVSRKVFGLKLRQIEGLLLSPFKLMGINISIPDFSTLSRRSGKASVEIPLNAKGKITAIVDSSGLKMFDEGEWKVGKHGLSKYRT